MGDSEDAWLDEFFDDGDKGGWSAGGAPVSEIPPSSITTIPTMISTEDPAIKKPLVGAASSHIPPGFQQERYGAPIAESSRSAFAPLKHTHGFRPPDSDSSLITKSAQITEYIMGRVRSTYNNYGPYILGSGILLVAGLWHRHDAKHRSRRHVQMAVSRIIHILEVNREYHDMIADQKRWGEVVQLMCREANLAHVAKQLSTDECAQTKESLKRKLASNELYISYERRKRRRDDEYQRWKRHRGPDAASNEALPGAHKYIARGLPLVPKYNDDQVLEGEVIEVRRSVTELGLADARRIALSKGPPNRPDAATKSTATSDPGVGSSKASPVKTGKRLTSSESEWRALMPPPAKKIASARPPKPVRPRKKVAMLAPPTPTPATKATGEAGKKPGGSDVESLTGSEAGSRRSSRATLFTGTYPK